jgi:hypothetical protein
MTDKDILCVLCVLCVLWLISYVFRAKIQEFFHR